MLPRLPKIIAMLPKFPNPLLPCYPKTIQNSYHVTLLHEKCIECYLVARNKYPMLPCYLKPIDGVRLAIAG